METKIKVLVVLSIVLIILLVAYNIKRPEGVTTTTTTIPSTTITTTTTTTVIITTTTTTIPFNISKFCSPYNVTCIEHGVMYEIIYICDGKEERFYTGIKNLTKLREEIKNLGKACEEMMESKREMMERMNNAIPKKKI